MLGKMVWYDFPHKPLRVYSGTRSRHHTHLGSTPLPSPLQACLLQDCSTRHAWPGPLS